MNTIIVKASHKLFHNDRGTVLGKLTATEENGKITFSKFSLDDEAGKLPIWIVAEYFSQIKAIIKSRIPDFLSRPIYCIQWDENNCVETEMNLR